MPNLFNSEIRRGVNQLHEYAGYSLLEWFKHDGYEPEYVLCKNFKADKSNGTCIWNEGEYTTSYQQGQRMFRDRLFELEDFEDLQLPENFNYLKDTLINKAQGDHAKRVDEFPYFYELMDVYGFSFKNKGEYIGSLSSSPKLSLAMPRINKSIIVCLDDVNSVSDFVDKIKEYADNFDVGLEKTCIDNKKSLMAFSKSLLHWENSDNEGLHQEFSNAQEQNMMLRKDFPDSDVLDLYIQRCADNFLVDLPTGKIDNKRADIKKEALDTAKGGSGKQAVRNSEMR